MFVEYDPKRKTYTLREQVSGVILFAQLCESATIMRLEAPPENAKAILFAARRATGNSTGSNE